MGVQHSSQHIFDNILKGVLRHCLDGTERTVKIFSRSKSEAALCYIKRADLSCKVIKPTENISVDLLKSLCRTDLNVINKPTVKKLGDFRLYHIRLHRFGESPHNAHGNATEHADVERSEEIIALALLVRLSTITYFLAEAIYLLVLCLNGKVKLEFSHFLP